MAHRSLEMKLISGLYFRLLPIQLILAAVNAVNGMISSLFAGNCVGKAAMSAIGLYVPFNLFIAAVALMLMGGAQLLCGESMGRNEKDRMQNVFSINLLVSVAVSAAFIAGLVLLVVTGATRLMARDDAVRRSFDAYLLGQAVGVLPFVLGQQLSAFLSLENRTRRTSIASFVFVLTNLALNAVLVGGLGMGALGLALAPSLGLWVYFGIQAQYYVSGQSMLKLRLRGVRRSDVPAILKTGYPGALSQVYQTLRGFILNALILQFAGNAGLSAFAASNALLGLVWSLPTAMVAVSRMLIGISIGEEDRRSLTDVMRVMFSRCVPLMGAVSALIIVSAVPLTRLYYREPADPVFGMTVMAFRILPLCMPLSVICIHFVCYAQASGKQLLVHILSLLDGVVCVAGFTALLIPVLGMNGVYVSNILNGLTCAAVIVLYSWAVRRAFPRNMEELMVIPADFGVKEDERIDIAVRSMDDVVTVSRQVTDFCLEHGTDRRRASFAGLFLEEMAGNVVRHGFSRDAKKHSVDIRVAHKGDDVILRIRDDCVPFDPAERKDLVDPEDRAKNMGIRLVYRMAKDIRHQNILGLNVLTIRI